MSEKSAAERFCEALMNDGYVWYVPENVWRARQAGLLPGFYLRDWISKFPKYPSIRDTILPTFTKKEEWDEVILNFNLKGKNRSHIYYNGTVLQITFLESFLLQSEESKSDEKIKEEVTRLRREFGLPVIGQWPKKFKCKFAFCFRKYTHQDIENMRASLNNRLKREDPIDIVRISQLFNRD